ncbi:MAG: hypothetical protein PHQ89_02590 [Bacilli bacterium]|nr:hypothetical protein [Bacilli bacterium]
MKKLKFLLLLLIPLFFFQIKDVKAFVGSYVYDINSFKLEGGYIYISGWAVLSIDNLGADGYDPNTTRETHNIDPTFVLKLRSENNAIVKNYTNILSATPIRDYTRPYFDDAEYPAGTGNLSTAIKNLICSTATCTNKNYIYRNNDFKFRIPVTDFAAIRQSITSGKWSFYLELNITLTPKTGLNFRGKIISTYPSTYTKKILLGIQNNRISEADEKALYEMDPLIKFINRVTQVQLVATNAKVRCIQGNTLLGPRLQGNKTCSSTKSDNILYNRGNAGETYDVYGQTVITSVDGIQYWGYDISVDRYGLNTSLNLDWNQRSYIPAFWVNPKLGEPTKIVIIKPSSCDPTSTIPTNNYSDNEITNNLKCNESSSSKSTINGGEQTIFQYNDEGGNVYCSLKCSEQIVTTFNASPSLRAGTGYKYPVVFNGTRTCSFTYNESKLANDLAIANSWIEKANRINDKELVKKVGTGESNVTLYEDTPGNPQYCQMWKARAIRLNEIKAICNSTTINTYETGDNKYDITPTITAEISTSTINKDIVTYSKEKTNSSTNTRIKSPTAVDLDWKLESKIEVVYGFSKYYYIEKYTGKKVTDMVNGVNYTTDENGSIKQNKYFTELTELTGKYNLNLALINVGRNLKNNWVKKWKINMDCDYSVDNKIFPQKKDDNYKEYGAMAFSFRQISLTNPFPGRAARENWLGYENLITDKGKTVYNAKTAQYAVALSPADMLSIREYNEQNAYSVFNMRNGTEKSLFIHNYFSRFFEKAGD